MATLAVAKNEPVYKLEQAKLQENKLVSCLLQDDRKTGFIAGIELHKIERVRNCKIHVEDKVLRTEKERRIGKEE